MKKMLALAFVLVLAFSFTACDSGSTNSSDNSNVTPTATPNPTPTLETNTTPDPTPTQPQPNEYDEEVIISSDTVDLAGMEIYWQSDQIPFESDSEAMLNLYVSAYKNDNGEFFFDDGQDWLLVMETDIGNFSIFPRQYIQLGEVSCNAFTDSDNVFHVLITVSQSAGYKIYDCIFDSERSVFVMKTIYEMSGINSLSRTE
ncbi:MAG: hypothetical protein LBU94_01620 [Clostridiales bacterium]|jgi:hypothetical protein|nr:hypothetical protein [Clostridiales bacterium]